MRLSFMEVDCGCAIVDRTALERDLDALKCGATNCTPMSARALLAPADTHRHCALFWSAVAAHAQKDQGRKRRPPSVQNVA
jgi:hypothetical protein